MVCKLLQEKAMKTGENKIESASPVTRSAFTKREAEDHENSKWFQDLGLKTPHLIFVVCLSLVFLIVLTLGDLGVSSGDASKNVFFMKFEIITEISKFEPIDNILSWLTIVMLGLDLLAHARICYIMRTGSNNPKGLFDYPFSFCSTWFSSSWFLFLWSFSSIVLCFVNGLVLWRFMHKYGILSCKVLVVLLQQITSCLWVLIYIMLNEIKKRSNSSNGNLAGVSTV